MAEEKVMTPEEKEEEIAKKAEGILGKVNMPINTPQLPIKKIALIAGGAVLAVGAIAVGIVMAMGKTNSNETSDSNESSLIDGTYQEIE